MADRNICQPKDRWGGRSESETSVQLNLTRSANSGEYSADVAGEVTRYVFEHGVSVPSQAERTLRVAWHCKIWAIQ